MIAAVVRFPVIFISGIFIPLDELPAWGQAISYISPLTYFTDIARSCMQGRGHLPLALDFIALIAFTLFWLVSIYIYINHANVVIPHYINYLDKLLYKYTVGISLPHIPNNVTCYRW